MIPEQGCSRENSLLAKIFVELVSTFWDFQRVGGGGGGGLREKSLLSGRYGFFWNKMRDAVHGKGTR